MSFQEQAAANVLIQRRQTEPGVALPPLGLAADQQLQASDGRVKDRSLSPQLQVYLMPTAARQQRRSKSTLADESSQHSSVLQAASSGRTGQGPGSEGGDRGPTRQADLRWRLPDPNSIQLKGYYTPALGGSENRGTGMAPRLPPLETEAAAPRPDAIIIGDVPQQLPSWKLTRLPVMMSNADQQNSVAMPAGVGETLPPRRDLLEGACRGDGLSCMDR